MLTQKKGKKSKQQLSEIMEMSFRSEAFHTAAGKALAPSVNPPGSQRTVISWVLSTEAALNEQSTVCII